MVTAGPTFEEIDPVRFIGNHSSGKMGFAIANNLAEKGAEVILIAGPNQLSIKNENIQMIDVKTADQMYDAVMDHFSSCDAAVMSAAVSDYKPIEKFDSKVKRGKGNLTIELVPNKDIAASVGEIKNETQVLVGFALETNNELENAKKKIRNKNLDFIVLNSLQEKGAGFGVDTNKITIIDNKEKITEYPLKSKNEVADDIVNYLQNLFEKK